MEINIDNLHHAYLLEGDTDTGVTFVYGLLERLGISSIQNPDLHIYSNDSFTIDEARKLADKAQGKAFGSKKIFIISSPKFSLQAQNALLKTFEEPFENTHFFIVLSSRELLIPTLLSRLEIHRLEASDEKDINARKFLDMNTKERMNLIKKFVDNEKPLSPFLDSLMLELRKNADNKELEKVFNVRKYSDDPSAMSRLILEHLALVLK
ncbi:MAG: hypothetical protein WAV25_01575 [Minisyncoccia bacterium]